jgi:hypothetical protein
MKVYRFVIKLLAVAILAKYAYELETFISIDYCPSRSGTAA